MLFFMGKQYSEEFKAQVIREYYSGAHGGRRSLAKFYNLNPGTIWNWIAKKKRQGDLLNDINHRRGRQKEVNIDYKERYEILKKYQEFIKAQREKK